MAGRFEPTKSGRYLVEYLENGSWVKENVQYDKKDEKWTGSKESDFYKERIRSWYF